MTEPVAGNCARVPRNHCDDAHLHQTADVGRIVDQTQSRVCVEIVHVTRAVWSLWRPFDKR